MENFSTLSSRPVPSALSPFTTDDSRCASSQSTKSKQGIVVLSLFDDAEADFEAIVKSEFSVPHCYLRSANGGESELKLKQSQLKQFSLDTLFYCFYMMPDDILQTVAGQELLARGWRYYKDQRIWLRPAITADNLPSQQGIKQYMYFDTAQWCPKLFNSPVDHTRLMVASDYAPAAKAPSFGNLRTSPH